MGHELHLPILILPNLVFFPHTTLPLHIVDKNTVVMFKKACAEGSPVAISMAEPMLAEAQAKCFAPKDICGYGIPVILEESPEGTLKVLIKGQGRVRLIKPTTVVPYTLYQAQTIEDTSKEFIYCHDRVERLREILYNWLDETIFDAHERESFKQGLRTIHQVVDYVSLFLIQDREIRQILLENTSLFERISMLNLLLQGEAPLSEDTMVAKALKHYDNLGLEESVVSGH